VVERGQEADAQHQHDRPVEADQDVGGVGQPLPYQPRTGDDQRQCHHPGHDGEQVEAERQGPRLDDPAVPAQPVHDRDGVDEHVHGPGARPEREHEPHRDHVEAPALEHVVDGRLDHLVDGRVGEEPRGQVDDRAADVLDLVGLKDCGDVTDRTGSAKITAAPTAP
jgi:hypothetical protein